MSNTPLIWSQQSQNLPISFPRAKCSHLIYSVFHIYVAGSHPRWNSCQAVQYPLKLVPLVFLFIETIFLLCISHLNMSEEPSNCIHVFKEILNYIVSSYLYTIYVIFPWNQVKLFIYLGSIWKFYEIHESS